MRKIAEPVFDAGFPRQCFRAARDLRRQSQRGIQAVGQKDVLQNIEIADEFEALKNQSDLRNAERAARGFAQRIQLAVLHANGSARGGQDAGNQMQQGGFPRTARPDDRDALRRGDLQRRNGEAEIGMRKMKFEIGNGDHSFLKHHRALDLALPGDVHGGDFPCGRRRVQLPSRPQYSLMRVWMWPQCSTVPSTCQVRRSTKPFLLLPSAGSAFRL